MVQPISLHIGLDKKKLSAKLYFFYYPSVLTYMFWLKYKKIIFLVRFLTKGLLHMSLLYACLVKAMIIQSGL